MSQDETTGVQSTAPTSEAARLMRLLDYELPEELIAQHPAARREDARLLLLDRASGRLTDSRFADIGRWLRPGDLLVVNETRVRPARLMVKRPTGGRVELLFVRPAAGHPAQPGPAAGESWRVLAKPARHANVGARLATDDGALGVEVIAAGEQGERVVRIAQGSLDAVLRQHGEVPLPPYIHRAPEAEDVERYQTVYARVDGAVAAPTAGLHFSESLLASLEASGISRAAVTLHVGPGTFRPISTEDPREHEMEEEWFEVGEAAAAAMRSARERGGRIVAVGTTTVRALESMADANAGGIAPATGWTRKYILPPYRFQAVDALITNFHLPRTTLLLLVAAFAGEERLREAYAHAVRERYRFYSYGDAMLVLGGHG
jgi:S-adenosylmethionine:tRNA ribosyltransferase-isomerase